MTVFPSSESSRRIIDKLDANLRELNEMSAQSAVALIEPTNLDTSRNPLRPGSFDEMVGQERMRKILKRLVDACQAAGEPMDHVLLVGASGTGKTTTAIVLARELHTRAFLLKAPVDMDTLERLRVSAEDGDVVFVDEIHLWSSGDRRGRTQAPDPESVFTLLEDGVLMTAHGQLEFPHVTWIGATTDVGMLPEPLVNRFPIQPALEPYTDDDMVEISRRNAQALNLSLEDGVAEVFAGASRRNPRQLNSYMRATCKLAAGPVDKELAREVIEDLNGTTLDGLDRSMQAMLRYIYRFGRTDTKDGVLYKASAGALATAAGHGRDTKAIYSKEIYLVESGLLSIQPRGRTLTTQGIQRSKELT